MQSVPWWLWLNILGLDAPLIAVLWQDLFARTFAIPLDFPMRLGLFCATWTIYLGDRLIDGIKLKITDSSSARHQFAAKHPRILVALLFLALIGISYAAFTVPRDILLGAIGLGFSSGIYFLWNQAARGTFARKYFKEIIISLIFVMGIILVPLLQGMTINSAFVIAAVLFFSLCLSNCAMISCIERDADIARGEESYAVHFSRHLKPARWLSAAVAFGAFGLGLTKLCSMTFAIPCILSGAGMWSAIYIERRANARFAAAWVDLCLMTPFFTLLFPFT